MIRDVAQSEPMTVPAGRTVAGRVSVPPSKSVAQRHLALALVGRLALRFDRSLESEDTQLFQAAIRACGFGVQALTHAVTIDPPAEVTHHDEDREVPIFCGNGGTMCRLLTAALTTVPGRFRLSGVPRLHQRPIGPLVNALRQLGAEIAYLERDGFPPLAIRGATLDGGHAKLDARASSQYLSALLIAGQSARRSIELTVEALASSPYVALTLDAIRDRGGAAEGTPDHRSYRTEPRILQGGPVRVEGDFSAAAYPAAAAALQGGTVTIEGLRADSAQGDRSFFDLLARMGVPIAWRGDALTVGRAACLRPVAADLGAMPDQVPTLAALAAFADGQTVITGVAHLRIKECDRLDAMARELGRLGVSVTEHSDGLTIDGKWAHRQPATDPVTVRAYGDHRIAMALALVGLRRPGVTIDDPSVVGKSYPRFWDDLGRLIRK